MSASASPPPQASAEAGPTATQNELYNQVFGVGEDGEDSDLSDLEDENQRPRGRFAFPKRVAPAADADVEMAAGDETVDPAGADIQAENDDDEDDEDDVDEAYVPATATSSAKIPKFKKTKRTDDDDEEDEEDDVDEDVDVSERRRKKKKRKERVRRDRSVPRDEEEEAQPIYDEATQRRMALEERIDNIGKKQRVIRHKKKGDDEDIIDSYHDEVCARLRDRMLSAADKDEASNRAKLPGTAKLAMLDEVMGVLRNTTLWQSIVDNGVLEAVKRWLEPLPDKSLPSVGIQKAIFEVLPKMDLDTTTLKECRLGPIVLFYTKTKRVTPGINRQADALVQSWSRPIIKRPANFRSKHVESQGMDEGERESSQPQGGQRVQQYTQSQNQSQSQSHSQTKSKRFDIKTALDENKNRKGARKTLTKDIQYTIAPESRTHHLVEEMQHVSRIQMDNKKFNKFARQMKVGKGATGGR